MELGRRYVFELASGEARRIAVIGTAPGKIELEVDGTVGVYEALGDAIGGPCIGFRKDDANE